MSRAPVEAVLVALPGGPVDAGLVAAVEDLTRSGTVRILDLLLVTRAADGSVSAVEVDELDDRFDAIDGEYGGLVSDRDVEIAAEALEPDSTVAVLIWENVWAGRFVEALSAAGGRVVLHERIPAAEVDAAFAALTEE